jgi:cytochrome c oxidase subunit 3
MLGDLNHQVLWPDFKAVWPARAAAPRLAGGIVEPFQTIGPSGCRRSTPRCC